MAMVLREESEVHHVYPKRLLHLEIMAGACT